jgi:hypothetical protein
MAGVTLSGLDGGLGSYEGIAGLGASPSPKPRKGIITQPPRGAAMKAFPGGALPP